MRFSTSPGAKTYFTICLLAFCTSGFGITLQELRNSPDITPKQFAAYFSDFEFKFRTDVQTPEMFLATRSGDCDDFSTLAALVLRERGYTPRLITVRMPGVVHVVCYIEETQSYLDYNNRGLAERTVKCGPRIEAVAASVAKSYDLTWNSATEFTYENQKKRIVRTVTAKRERGLLAVIFR